MTLHQHGYIPSVFDVVHDAGRSTALFSSKDKFVLFDQSYDQTNGAANEHGRDKIDMFFTEDDGPPKFSQTMNERFIAEMGAHHFNYAFVHYRDADSVGHVLRWDSGMYRWAVQNVDGFIAGVFRLVETDPKLKGKTAIVLTSDHGGSAFGHVNPTLKENFTVPVFVWGAGVAHGDLYAMNRESREDPGDKRIDYAAETPADSQRRYRESGAVAAWTWADSDFDDQCEAGFAHSDTTPPAVARTPAPVGRLRGYCHFTSPVSGSSALIAAIAGSSTRTPRPL